MYIYMYIYINIYIYYVYMRIYIYINVFFRIQNLGKSPNRTVSISTNNQNKVQGGLINILLPDMYEKLDPPKKLLPSTGIQKIDIYW
jgi:hypothetical protein